MIFEKKIIIGSITSFVVTAIGIIAIFFPDLLNLQKKKMESLTIAVEDSQSFDKLSSFLEERARDKKIFQLYLEICNPIGSIEMQNSQGLAWQSMDAYFNEPTLTKFNLEQIAIKKGIYSSLDECNEWCKGVSYIFPSESIGSSSVRKETNCSVYGTGFDIVDGFFIHEEKDYTKGDHEYNRFKLIPKESVLIRDY